MMVDDGGRWCVVEGWRARTNVFLFFCVFFYPVTNSLVLKNQQLDRVVQKQQHLTNSVTQLNALRNTVKVTAAVKTVVVVAIADIRLTPTFVLVLFSSLFSAGTTPVPSTCR